MSSEHPTIREELVHEFCAPNLPLAKIAIECQGSFEDT